MVFQDCYQRRCEPTCESINDPTICPKLPNLCFPGCYCPAGLVRKGDECISPSSCRDCECNVLPHLQYVTYDESNFTVSGNCVYVMSRDQSFDGKHTFQVPEHFKLLGSFHLNQLITILGTDNKRTMYRCFGKNVRWKSNNII